jgi:predicted ABC-type ATPase
VSPFLPEAAAFRAGRVMLSEIELLAKRGVDFGFETTLSGRTHISLFRQLRTRSYALHLFFLWVPSVELALSRVRSRAKAGGHNVPAQVVRRRFHRSVANFFRHYVSRADSWILFDNSARVPEIVASQDAGQLRIIDQGIYNRLRRRYGGET